MTEQEAFDVVVTLNIAGYRRLERDLRDGGIRGGVAECISRGRIAPLHILLWAAAQSEGDPNKPIVQDAVSGVVQEPVRELDNQPSGQVEVRVNGWSVRDWAPDPTSSNVATIAFYGLGEHSANMRLSDLQPKG